MKTVKTWAVVSDRNQLRRVGAPGTARAEMEPLNSDESIVRAFVSFEAPTPKQRVTSVRGSRGAATARATGADTGDASSRPAGSSMSTDPAGAANTSRRSQR